MSPTQSTCVCETSDTEINLWKNIKKILDGRAIFSLIAAFTTVSAIVLFLSIFIEFAIRFKNTISFIQHH